MIWIIGIIALVYAYFAFFKYDKLKSTLNGWAKVDFMPDDRMPLYISAGAGLVLMLLMLFAGSTIGKYSDVISIVIPVIMAAVIGWFIYKDTNRKRGALLGVYHALSCFVVFITATYLSFLILVVAVFYLVVKFFLGGGSSSKTRYKTDCEHLGDGLANSKTTCVKQGSKCPVLNGGKCLIGKSVVEY